MEDGWADLCRRCGSNCRTVFNHADGFSSYKAGRSAIWPGKTGSWPRQAPDHQPSPPAPTMAGATRKQAPKLAKAMNNDDEIQEIAESEREAYGKPSHFDMDEA